MKVLAVCCAVLACPAPGKPPDPIAKSPNGPTPAEQPAPSSSAAPSSEGADVTAEHYQSPRMPKARVFLTGPGNRKIEVEAEVALTRDARTRGLMWRYSLPEGTGMLFIFPREQPQSFWMRNTLIPLDMIFIDSKGKVVSIQENAEPRTTTSRPSTGPATYVLEVPGGWSAKKGIKAGSAVTFQGVTNLIPEE